MHITLNILTVDKATEKQVIGKVLGNQKLQEFQQFLGISDPLIPVVNHIFMEELETI